MVMLRVGGCAAGDTDGQVAAGGSPGDAVGEGGVGAALPVGAAGDADAEGVAGDAPAVGVASEANGEGAAGDAPDVGAAGDADGEGTAAEAMVDGAAGDALMVSVLWLTMALVITTVTVLQVMVLGVGPRMGCWLVVLGVAPRHCWRRVWWAFLVGWLAGPAGVGRLSCVGSSSPILVDGAAGDADREGHAGDGVVDANGEGVAGVVPGDAEGEGAVGGDAAAGWRCRW